MASQIQFGRVGLDPSTGLRVGPGRVSHEANSLQFSGWIRGSTSSTAAQAIRQQLLGLVDSPDEDAVPVIWSDDTTYDGYYHVQSAGVEMEPKFHGAQQWQWSVDAVRVPGYQAPLIENRVRGAARTNGHGLASTEVRPFVGVPKSISDFSESNAFSGGRVAQRPNFDGSTTYVFHATTGSNSSYYHDATPSYHLPAANYYDSACKIVVGQHVAVGRQIRNLSTQWEISNGIVRVKPTTTAGELEVAHYDGSSFDTKNFILGFFSGSFLDIDTAPHTISVLRNTPETVAIRLYHTETADLGSTDVPYPITVDLAIRRGSVWVEGFLATPPLASWGVRTSAAEAADSTALTGGIEASTTDANGNKYLLAVTKAFTYSTSLGHIYLTVPDDELTFGIGAHVGGATSTGSFGTPQGVVNQYYAADFERQKVGVR